MPGGMGSVFAVQVGENLLDHHRVFDAGDDLYGATAAFADFDVDVAYRDVGQGREQERKL